VYQGEVEGDYPFFKVSDMNNRENSTFMVSANNWISENTRQKISANTFPQNTIVLAKIGAAIFLGRKRILSQESCLDNNMMGFILNPGAVYYRFIHYIFEMIRLGKLVSTTALPSLNGKEIAALLYGFPSLPEEDAIAIILSDMDAEIAALEVKLAKARELKQGMMQELLTGNTRLIENAEWKRKMI
jgi:type I restriction enzyme S subunit